ncbi:hypothetical protein AV530_019659 [Patagioenas fasciata monilis]|uniref:Uncharacterized protein n=1 Tax=Patagioenas fasciata monilis TaxID=372326 RepID=A0A1V4JEG9_PATFA|nr:hypothetical protein AV530_019659 [Patagioenas fasciata monilis]
MCCLCDTDLALVTGANDSSTGRSQFCYHWHGSAGTLGNKERCSCTWLLETNGSSSAAGWVHSCSSSLLNEWQSKIHGISAMQCIVWSDNSVLVLDIVSKLNK